MNQFDRGILNQMDRKLAGIEIRTDKLRRAIITETNQYDRERLQARIEKAEAKMRQYRKEISEMEAK